ncbi:mitochondrial ribosome assembly protein RRG9 [Aspergillus melleus]|uniref:mitochondrial ribosome assembly protein RRG9 n=1 Tax=Aspergillus melleus TaxID=138277 RepID=UPI001E8EC3C0|nr:Required for respiratory growth protein 9 mitochondrial [Aspergillus melleus]KAH8424737.1 Required for respiratory growth protein 9 mitochondrial [Aspergillus melleus]
MSSLRNLFRTCLRAQFTHESSTPLNYRNHLVHHGAFLPYRRCQNATRFSTHSGRRSLEVDSDIISQQILLSNTDRPSSSRRQKKKQDQTDATRKPKRTANTAKPPARAGSKSTQKRSSGSSHTKTHSATDRAPLQPKPKKKLEGWQIQKAALKDKFQDGWNPTKKLSPDALEGIRHLHSIAPEKFTTPVLAEQFEVSPEAIRRILKSKWRATEEELNNRRERWERRHDRIWNHLTQLGLRPPTRRTTPSDDVSILYEKRGDERK